jgi:hypothetical protein
VDEELRSDPQFSGDILEPIEILGLDRFADSAIIIKARTKTRPIKQWNIGREFNRRLKRRFDEKNIEIPFPHVTLYIGQDKAGQAPPLNVAMEGGASRGPLEVDVMGGKARRRNAAVSRQSRAAARVRRSDKSDSRPGVSSTWARNAPRPSVSRISTTTSGVSGRNRGFPSRSVWSSRTPTRSPGSTSTASMRSPSSRRSARHTICIR